MFKNIKIFLKTTLLGGLGVVLPLIIITVVFYWVFSWLTELIEPLAELIFERTAVSGIAADLLTVAILIGLCFAVGIIVKSAFGRLIHALVEDQFLKKIPGYGMVTDTVRFFTDGTKTPFSEVALIKPFGNDTMMTGFITDQYKDIITIFVPTGPNPTSGNIYHLKKEFVTIVDVTVEDTMQSIIGGGAGSQKLLRKIKASKKRSAKKMK